MEFIRKLKKHTKVSFLNYGIVIAFYFAVQIMAVTGHLSNSLKGQLIPIVSYVIVALALNLVVGISGELSLGHAGFMSVGAFSGVVVSMSVADSIPNPGLRLVIAILVGAALAGVAGVVIGIPVLRLNGDYLAIVTLAFGEIIKNVMNCLYVGVDGKGIHVSFKDTASLGMAADGKILINGPMGATGITKLSTFMAGTILLVIVLVIIQNLVNSRTGLAIMAIRDNRIAAEASGVPVTKHKLIAFVTSAAIAGAAGALYALNYSTIAPKKFDFNTSILILVFVVLGGIGNMTGTIIAAALLTMLPELLRKFADYRMLIYAIVLILVMIATNNEKIRSFIRGIGKSAKKEDGANE
ncbi:MAG: branched-chain amino acid ABC transporter permease [Lachnospiraceae bacterium]|nr:branched-chain amino acid ABC transporter permease [Lachnospiraceae bacterium]